MSGETVAPDVARLALDRILDSPEFASATRLSSFLRYVVTESLSGRRAAIKGYSIAIDVFDRPADFDQTNDPIVRVEASRLRRALAQYYQGSGSADPVVIDLPRGAYVPAFRWREPGQDEPPVVLEPVPVPSVPPEPPAAHPNARPGVVVGLPSILRFRAIMLAGVSLVLAALAFLVWDAVMRPSGPSQPAGASATVKPDARRGPLVSVSAIDTLSGDDTDARIARDLASELVAEFARFRNLSVLDVDDDGPSQASGYIVSGNLRRSGDEIRVTIQLMDASARQTIWSETYNRVYTAKTALSVQDEIARSVAIAVGQPYGAVYQREVEKLADQPLSATGYPCVLRVSNYWRTLDPQTHLAMRTCLEATVAAEPDYADAWQALTYMYLDEYRYGFNVRPRSAYEPLNKAKETAQKAVDLSPTDARSYQALYAVYFYRGDREGFRRAGAEAVRLNPNSPDISADFGGKLAFSGGWEEGLPLVRRAMALNPGHPGWYYVSLILDAYRRGAYDEALAFIERMNLPEHYRTYIFTAMTYGQMGDKMKAAAAVERLLALDPDFALNARSDMKKWGFQPSLVDLCIEGLVKAGMTITDG